MLVSFKYVQVSYFFSENYFLMKTVINSKVLFSLDYQHKCKLKQCVLIATYSIKQHLAEYKDYCEYNILCYIICVPHSLYLNYFKRKRCIYIFNVCNTYLVRKCIRMLKHIHIHVHVHVLFLLVVDGF